MAYALREDGSFRAVDDESWLENGEVFVLDQPEVKQPDPQLDINAKARAYLASTDWYFARSCETGEPIPDDILLQRKEARASVQ